MIVSPDADELLAEIRELRSARREQLARDLAGIDAAYDRTVRRVSVLAGEAIAASTAVGGSIFDVPVCN
jgi:hypothetical protein